MLWTQLSFHIPSEIKVPQKSLLHIYSTTYMPSIILHFKYTEGGISAVIEGMVTLLIALLQSTVQL